MKTIKNRIMKKTIAIVLLMCTLFSIHAQELSDYLKKGTKLRYYLHNSGNDYEFIVDIESLGKEISFNWWMTEPASNSGSVKMTEKAVNEAVWQQNYFRGGHDDLDTKTTVWVSKKVYNALKNKEEVEIFPENTSVILTYVEDRDYTVMVNGKKRDFKCLYAEGDNGDKFWILDDPDNPVILKMVISFNIEIGEIMTKEYWED
jgi:hypothetical protein